MLRGRLKNEEDIKSRAWGGDKAIAKIGEFGKVSACELGFKLDWEG